MKVNWPERIWVNSPVRKFVQKKEAKFFSGLHSLPTGTKCLEIGCGCGVGARIIHQTFSPSAIHAIDIDEEMLRKAKQKMIKWNNIPLQLLVGDAQQLPYPADSFDAVFNYGIIHHLENWQQGVAEIARVLKKNGVFYFEEIYPPLYANPLFKRILDHPRENRFHGPEYRDALQKEGLRLLEKYKESRFAILGAAVKES